MNTNKALESRFNCSSYRKDCELFLQRTRPLVDAIIAIRNTERPTFILNENELVKISDGLTEEQHKTIADLERLIDEHRPKIADE